MPFRLPTQVTMAPGSLRRLPALVEDCGSGPVLLVHDAGLAQTPWPAQVAQALTTAGRAVHLFTDVEPNPRHTTVDAMAAQARADGVGVVVGLGGGSVLDAAKAVAMLLRNPGACADYEGKNQFDHPAAPFIAVPTTCGTGSEVTWVSVITRADEQRKMSLKGDGMFPAHALVDADLLQTLPTHLVAQTGADALTHALEALTCTEANPVSDVLAEKAVLLLLRYLRRAVVDIEGDAEAREAVMRAATLAGMAFGNADVAAVHCLSETLGGRYDVPHGLANAVLLVPVFRSHLAAGAATAPLARLYGRLTPAAARARNAPADDAESFLDAIERLLMDLSIPGFDALEVPPADYAALAQQATENNSNASNPRPMDAAAYRAILEALAA